MSSTPGGAGQLPPRQAIKRHLLIMVGSIVALDAVAISVFYAFHLNRDFGGTRTTFVGVWTLLSFLIVAVQLRRIRRARLEIIRGTSDHPPPRP